MPEDPEIPRAWDELVKSKPIVRIFSDHPIDQEDYWRDSFNLSYHLSPIYDIIRHPDTKPPMAVAITGSWGTGKTSGMKWLGGLLKAWNETDDDIKGDSIKRIKTVWFHPWKYQNREDVWKGLIAEVILASVQIKGASPEEVKKAGKHVLRFLGKAGLGVLGDILGVDAQNILNEFDENIEPQLKFIHEYEHQFQSWVEETVGNDDRIVIFVDDLDRCLPGVALQVMEALKLYLNVRRLIFVVGIDDKVIREVVKNHYEENKLNAEHSRDYLEKIFQVEVELSPDSALIREYIERLLSEINAWGGIKLDEGEENDGKLKLLFNERIINLAERNPREAKRLINELLIAAGGWSKAIPVDGKKIITTSQWIQLQFLKKILRKRYGASWAVGDVNGDGFFRMWSRIVLEQKDDGSFNSHLPVNSDALNSIVEYHKQPFERSPDSDIDMVNSFVTNLPEAEPYSGILINRKFTPFIGFLCDEDIGELMHIPYAEQTGEFVRTEIIKDESKRLSQDDRIILEVVARELSKEPDEFREGDELKIEVLNLDSTPISDMGLLRSFKNLRRLNLSQTNVKDIEVLSSLTNLSELYLHNTQVSDIGVLSNLTNLSSLNLSNTQVSDIGPLSGLTDLSSLILSNTQVSDIGALSGLTNLSHLYLPNTQVSDIGALSGLTMLSVLYLHDTEASDIGALSGLKNLSELYLYNTHVSDIGALSGLTKLSSLNLSSKQVSDIGALRGLTNLSWLYLSNTQVSDIGALSGLTKMSTLSLAYTQVRDIGALSGLTNLSKLDLSYTQVSDIEALSGLTKLIELILSGTQVSDSQIESLKSSIPGLKIKQ